ncbi:molybdopterin-dependent oxidoreductase [Dyadobacter sp. LHD-138]|uniref:molybdopterin-dependent oxidoreductase n=1 Tax=Dyadobacter sp. LHD-138 TaxID=3071413 RepID=UPI0027DFD576|nr:molybdopterin-dependent oxidoreductase [Dyadobacter sp. LHD-138]MDQ6482027.1 molybdopterin-dependent oxidoreductase [Dyadobacter sp. LHD-138]
MSLNFTPAEKAVHYPDDRRFVLGLKPDILIGLALVFLTVVGTSWAQFLIFGLPEIQSPTESGESVGFPQWVRLSHWVNFFFLITIIRSGLSILADHPRLYWNNGCTPGTEWLRFTPVKVPKDRLWTAKDDARYINPIVGLPGYRHTVGLARHWHFIAVPFFVLNGLIFVVLLFNDDHWKKIVPATFQILPQAWAYFVHYATFHFPPEPNGFYHYNPLQQLTYFAVIFVLAPVAIVSGMAMSPAIENRFHWLPKIFGNRQGARSVHFLVMASYVIFLVVHVGLVIMTGLKRNMNHITLGTDSETSSLGIMIGASIVGFTILFAVFAHWLSWKKPRLLQGAEATINGNLWKFSIDRLQPKAYYKKEDITPFFWPNGKIPESRMWRKLSETNFRDFKLKVNGLVDNPVELSLEDLFALGKEESITMHHCIQGWSGIAEWGGVPLKQLIEVVRPHPTATTVVFYSFGEGLYGGVYYDTHSLDNCLKPGSLLAWEMNYQPLPVTYGAPLRLRVENQLGYKMVKWVERIEFVESHSTVGKGFGGKNQDDEYFDLLANT